MKVRLLTIILITLIASPCWATTVTFQQNVDSYTGASDATILSGTTNLHRTGTGSTKISTVGGDVFIVHFDISSIPSSAVVSSATLTLEVSEGNCTDETIRVREIQNPDDSGAFDDDETAGDAFNDYATWAYKDHGATTDWDTGASVDFGDVDNNTDEDSTTTGACPGFVSKSLTVTTMVSGWVADANSNGGMMLSCADACSVFVKNKRDSTSSNRPQLSVTYIAGSVLDAATIQGATLN